MPSEAIRNTRGVYLPPSHGDLTIGAQIAGIAFEHPSERRWLIAFTGCCGLAGSMGVYYRLAVLLGHRRLGEQHPGGVGARHRQL